MNQWLILSFLFAVACQQSEAASCRFFEHPFVGYVCELVNANVTQENQVLSFDTDNHLQGRADDDVDAIYVANSSTLEFFPNSLLQMFPNVRNLRLDGVGMRNLTPAAFVGCANVMILQLGNNHIESVPAGLFVDCSDLLVVNLSNNRISEIDDDAFVDLSDLIELYLNNNQLTSISANVLRNQANLEEFDLNQNVITEIADGAFRNLTSIILLRLSNNQLTELRPAVFGNELRLVTLYLNHNLLTSVPRMPLNAPRLKYITLSFNRIEEVNDADFAFSYANITNINLSNNQISSLNASAFENLENLDNLDVSYNRITAVDNTLFERVSSLYTFYLLGNVCANVRFDNIRSIDQEREIEDALDRCYYHFFEPVVTQTCNFVGDSRFGYTCDLTNVNFTNFRDKFNIDGEHLNQMTNFNVTGLRITNSNMARVPPSLFRIFPNVEIVAITDSTFQRIEKNTFEECGIVKVLDMSRNRIRTLISNSFDECYYIEELILDDNQITEIEPCNSFLLNIYQTRRLSMRNNVCVDRAFEVPSGQWLVDNYQDLVYRFLNRCFSLWYMFLDTPDLPPEVMPPPPEGETTTAVPLRVA